MLDVLETGEVVAGHWVAISLLKPSFYSFSCNEPLFFLNIFHLCSWSFRIYIATVNRVDSAPTSTHPGFVAVTAGESIQEQHHTNIHPGFDVLDTHPGCHLDLGYPPVHYRFHIVWSTVYFELLLVSRFSCRMDGFQQLQHVHW